MKQVKPLPSFERSVKKLNPIEKTNLGKSLKTFNQFLLSGILPSGLHFKKINGDKYELRVDIRLRIIVKLEGEIFYLVIAGNHNEIRKYLRKFRTKT